MLFAKLLLSALIWGIAEFASSGRIYCPQGADEKDCENGRQLVSWDISADDCGFSCAKGDKCIRKDQHCDDIKDCEDYSDEVDCVNDLDNEYNHALFPRRHDADLEEKPFCGPAYPTGCRCDCEDLFCQHLGLQGIQHIPPDNVALLDISGNSMGSIGQSTFNNWRNLKTLVMISANITNMEDRTFTLPYLKTLVLSNNGIQSIKFELFGLEEHNLMYLTLSHNPITEIADSSFAKLKTLVRLDLRNCKLTSIQRKTFHGLLKLAILILEENQIASITDRSFVPLRNLKILSLAKNNLTVLRHEMLQGMMSLMTLDLSYNKILRLDIQFWLPSLRELELQNNRIVMISNATFDFTAKLRSLNLKQNPLTDLTADVFANLNELQFAYFSEVETCSMVRRKAVCRAQLVPHPISNPLNTF